MQTEPKLTVERINALMLSVLFSPEEVAQTGNVPPENAVFVDAITRRYAFHPGRLEEYRSEIRELLAELPDNFQRGHGGGWSFLNACCDRNGRHWGEHLQMEALFALGMAINAVSLLAPREMWPMLPGGMPYFVVEPTH
jgi:hypothetical protein